MVLPAFPVQGADEASDVFLQRVQAFMDLATGEQERIAAVAAEQQRLVEEAAAEQQRLADEAAAEAQRLANKAAVQAHLQREAAEAVQQQQCAATTQVLQNEEQRFSELLTTWTSVPSAARPAPTPAEQEKTELACLLRHLLHNVNWQQEQLQRHAQAAYQQQQILKAAATDCQTLATAINSAKTQQNKSTTHLLYGWLKSRPDSGKAYKMPKFNVAKFDDYQKTDALASWTAFNTEVGVHRVPDDQRLNALYLQLIGGSHTFMNNLALQKACTIATLHTKITWEEFEQLWQTRFMVRNVRKTVMNELYHCSQGTMPTREWLRKWQKFVATPKFNVDLEDLRSEFFSRLCDGLTTALSNELQYETFDAVISRANILIQTDWRAANESREQQSAYVAKPGFQQHNANVILRGSQGDHAAAAASGEGDVVAAIPPRRTRARKKKANSQASEGAGQQPWTQYHISEEVYHLRLNLQVPVQTVYTQTPLQVAVTTQPVVSHPVQPQGTQPQQLAQRPVSQGPQPVVMQGPGQTQWVPKTAIAAPKPFTRDKRGEDLDIWLRAVPVYVRCKLTLPHEKVFVAASYLEGSAARWLSGLVQLQGYGHDFRAWAASQKLEDFLKMVEERWHDPQEAQRATDAILALHTRQFKSVREVADAVERLICVPGVSYDPQVLLTSYLRCFSQPLRNQLAKEANINMHNFPSFNKVALDLEAKIGHGQAPTMDGRKKTLPPNWKAKGRLMFVDNDGSTIEVDEHFQEGVGSEAASVETSEGGVVAVVAQKGKATGKRREGSRSRSQVDPNAPPWEKAGLTEDVWRDRYSRQTCIRCGQYGHSQYKCRNKKVTEKIPPTMGHVLR
ncbi:hypothetical protein CBR_g31064 [Chara braunii]|uniref:CCHC-type domain-containing protein n=1 Tax=Chara braunii TaxID=69332 RepID=A0A388LE73_CHABU|nr:hypothetical protein CBR_g31064 [Chara braunii]|eukprot:GBG80604.1 hypothetical protein CBR_g31064 [Chara braunii]